MLNFISTLLPFLAISIFFVHPQCFQTDLPRFSSPPGVNLAYYSLEFIEHHALRGDTFLVGG